MNTLNTTLEYLGISKEDIEKKLIDRMADQLLKETKFDFEDENSVKSDLIKKMNKLIQKQVDDTVTAIAEKHILPEVASYIENITLQQTNSWGEKIGKSLTFIEYMTQKAHDYLLEKVDFEGKPVGGNSYGNKAQQTRITHLVGKHLHYNIEHAMKDALAVATSSISTGLQETVKLKLEEISKNLKVSVKTS